MGRASGSYRVAEQVTVSEDDREEGYAEPPGPSQPSIYDGIPVEVPGTYRQSEYGRQRYRHPPVACLDPRNAATFRGFYRCPACGEKAQLAGQVRAAELGQEMGERWAEAVAGGVAQVFWLAVSVVRDLAYVAGVAWRWLTRRRAATGDGVGAASDVVRALVMMSMVAARNRQPPGAG